MKWPLQVPLKKVGWFLAFKALALKPHRHRQRMRAEGEMRH
jgi:hypothetical protein